MADIVPSTGQFPAPRLSVIAQLPMQYKLMVMIIAATAIALVAGGWIWSQTPDYRVLYANMSDRDGGAIIAAIQQMNVPYKFEGSGAILVPSNKVHEVRLRLAGQGLPKGGPTGFELMENPKFGTSQFLEQVNYQRALEGELARSIQSVSAVQTARVHLALSKQSVFVREQQKPSASVVLNVYPGRSLEPAQVSAIIHLVSSSVPDLPVKNVAVIDQHGNLLSSAGQNAPGMDPGQLRYVHELEQSYSKRVEAILVPIVGAGNVRAEVTADVDFSQVERAEELYRPNGTGSEPVVRSQQTSESTSSTPNGGTGGIPGAVSNQPPANATAALSQSPANASAAGGTANAATAVNARKDATINYEVDKTIRHVRQPLGGIRRLSVAVVVNHRREVDSAGKVSFKPLAESEMAKITELVKDAAGYSKERGDTVNVVNSPFTVVTPEIAPEPPFWKKPDLYQMVKEIGKNLLIAGAVIYLIFGVLRPLVGRVLAHRPAPVSDPEADAVAAGVAARRSNAALARRSYEERLQVAQQLAQEEPKLVANVVKEWMAAE